MNKPQRDESLVAAYVEKILSQRKGSSGALRQKAIVSSAIALDENEKNEIEKLVTTLTGGVWATEWRVLPDLLGGVKIQVGEWLIDTTLSSQLSKLVTTLTP